MLGLQQHTNILFSVTGADPGFHNVGGGGGGVGWLSVGMSPYGVQGDMPRQERLKINIVNKIFAPFSTPHSGPFNPGSASVAPDTSDQI